jgi:hypothetical protein
MFAFGGGLVIGFCSDLAFNDSFGGFGCFGLGVDVCWEDTMDFSWILGCELIGVSIFVVLSRE